MMSMAPNALTSFPITIQIRDCQNSQNTRKRKATFLRARTAISEISIEKSKALSSNIIIKIHDFSLNDYILRDLKSRRVEESKEPWQGRMKCTAIINVSIILFAVNIMGKPTEVGRKVWERKLRERAGRWKTEGRVPFMPLFFL